MPFLFPGLKYNNGVLEETVFDKAVSSDKPLTDIIERFIELMIKADPRGVLYSPLINRNLMKLLRLPIDMKPCLLSALVMHKIENSKYENYSTEEEGFIGSNLQTLYEVCEKYNEVWGDPSYKLFKCKNNPRDYI